MKSHFATFFAGTWFLFGYLISLTSVAAPLPTPFILKKWTSHSGVGGYQLEQEVSFSSDQQSVNLKETWLVENEDSLKLTVVGPREQRDLLRLVILYRGGQKIMKPEAGGDSLGNKVPAEFYDRFFFFRKPERLGQELVRIGVLSSQSLSPHLPRGPKDTEVKSDPRVRVERLGGLVFALGVPADSGAEASQPGVWLDQELIVPKKIRLASGSELTAENPTAYARGLLLPKLKSLRYDKMTVNFQILSVSWKGQKSMNLQLNAADISTGFERIGSSDLRKQIEEFYFRFR